MRPANKHKLMASKGSTGDTDILLINWDIKEKISMLVTNSATFTNDSRLKSLVHLMKIFCTWRFTITVPILQRNIRLLHHFQRINLHFMRFCVQLISNCVLYKASKYSIGKSPCLSRLWGIVHELVFIRIIDGILGFLDFLICDTISFVLRWTSSILKTLQVQFNRLMITNNTAMFHHRIKSTIRRAGVQSWCLWYDRSV